MKVFDKVASLFRGGDSDVAKLLASALKPLAAIAEDLPKRAAAYVLTGADSVALTAIENAPIATKAVVPGRYSYVADKRDLSHLSALYGVLLDDAFASDPGCLHRLGLVLAACFGSKLPYGLIGTDVSPTWFRALLDVAARAHRPTCAGGCVAHFGALTLQRCIDALADDGGNSIPLFDCLLRTDPERWGRAAAGRFPEFDRYLADEPEAVTAAARALDAAGREALCVAIRSAGAGMANIETLVGLATGSAKATREAAIAALTGADAEQLLTAVGPLFEAKAIDPKVHAVALVARVLGAGARPFLEARRADGVPKKVSDAMAAFAIAFDETPEVPQAEGAGYLAIDGAFVALAEPPELPAQEPFPREAIALVREAVDLYNTDLETRRASAEDKRYIPHAIDKSEVDTFVAQANGDAARVRYSLSRAGFGREATPYAKTIRRALAVPGVTLWHLLRLHVAGGTKNPPIVPWQWGETFVSECARVRARAELGDARALVEMQATMGFAHDDVVRLILDALSWLGADADPGLGAYVWPAFVAYPAVLEEAFGLRSSPAKNPPSAEAAMAALALFPKTPQALLGPLMRLAVTGTKGERRAARDLLASAPRLDERIASLLDDGKQETRADAAAWLAERNARESIPAIRAALERERSEPARASFLMALAKLGEDISSYVDEATLRAEAERGLAKTPQKNLAWFPFDVVPELHWSNGTPISREIVRWWIVLANKLKDPSRNLLFEFYFDRMDAGDVARLGTTILRAWVAYDTVHPPESEAIAYADSKVDATFAAYARYDKNMTRDRVYGMLKNEFLSQHPNSASDNRGILALASRAQGAEVAGIVRSYIKNYGGRISQAKALVSALASNPAPSAIQVVLATANRCKQRTVQEHAAALVQAIAEMRGWTPEELADNTIPTAGLDEDGTLELDCGPERRFTAKLDPAGKLELFAPSGKPAKTLPAARGEADTVPLAESKRAFASAKKEVAQVLDLQKARLYDAMCVQRSWPAPDWERLLATHPIVRLLCRRLVWTVLDETGRVVGSFRPLDDGTLTDPSDEPVRLDAHRRVALAHRAVVPDELDAAWAAHFADYEVTPLFTQFGRPTLALAETAGTADQIVDRRGWCIERLKLRGAVTKRGYQAGTSEDGGVFMEYVRTHPGAGVQVEMGFTGSYPGLENGRAALTEMTFRRIARRGGTPVPLAKVPPVLLSECWNDLHEVAALGTGFDPNWEKTTGF